METMMLGIKYVVFLALEVFVFAVMGAVLIAGLYQIVRDKIRESRRLDEVGLETPPTLSPATVPIRRDS
jgi:hypothetical protein